MRQGYLDEKEGGHPWTQDMPISMSTYVYNKNTTNTDISKSGTFLLVVDVSAKTLCAESRLFVPSSNDRHYYYDIFH